MKKMEEALNDCIERMAAGESLDSCLASYPEMAEDLKSLLQISSAVTDTAADIKPRPEFKAEARYRFHTALAEREKGKVKQERHARRVWSLKWATVALAVLVIFVVGGSTGIASAGAMPGDPLYSVKTFAERVQMAFTFGNENKAQLHLEFAERRAEEMQVLIDEGDLETANNIGVQMNNQIEMARRAAPTVLDSADIVTRLETLANKQVALLEAIYDKAPTDAQGAIDTLIDSVNTAYETAIEEIADALPDVQLLITGAMDDDGDKLTGAIEITNNSDVDAQVTDVKYTLFYATGEDNSLLERAKIIRYNRNFLELEVESVIEAQQTEIFDYRVNFSVPAGTAKIRGVVSVKIEGRNLWYYDIAEFDMPSAQPVNDLSVSP